MSNLRRMIRDERTKQKRTLRNVADEAGLRESQLSMIELGKAGLPPRRFLEIGKALGLSYRTLEEWWASDAKLALQYAKNQNFMDDRVEKLTGYFEPSGVEGG